MRKLKSSNEYGIHTIELYANNLKYSEVQKAIDRLIECGKIQKIKSDPYNIDRQLKSAYFVTDGLRLRIYQSHNRSNGIGFIINPCTMLTGKYQPTKLWIPTPEAVDKLLKCLSTVMNTLGLDSVGAEDLSLSQMDLTENTWYKDGTDLIPIIRNWKKCKVPRGFNVITSKDKGVNKHLFVMTTDKIAVKAYDKVYELKYYDRCPKELKDKSILRFEVSLKREAFLKKLHLSRKASLYDMLCAGYEHGQEILDDYYGKMFPFSGKIVRYKRAKKIIKEGIANSLLQEQMLYLLEKTSDSAGLSVATRKLKEHYTAVDDRRIKKIFTGFDKLKIAPITLPDS